MNRTAREHAQRRQARRRWTTLAVGGGLLAVAFAYGTYRYFEARAVLLRAEQVDAAMEAAVAAVGRKQPAGVECPDRDLREGDRVVCDVRFTDGSSGRLKFGVTGRPGRITPILEGV